MEKGTFWAIVGFMAMGIILSFTSMGIFLTKYNQDKEVLIQKKSILTDANALDWGATPGNKNISFINTFTFYTHKSGIMFETCKETLNYSYVSELSNRTYVPSSPGYIKYLPTFSFQKIQDHNGDVTNLNIAAIKYFYQSLNQPAFTKLPRYLTMIFKGLSEDFMNYYFTHTIYEFYTYDQDIVYNTIFRPAHINEETQNKLWNDELYGWKDEKTFSKWIRAQTNGGDYNLQLYFQLTDQQMKSLIGNGSTITKLKKLITNSVSTGVQGLKKGNCQIPDRCTLWELAQVQWSFGGLTQKDFVPPIQFGGGSYATFNDSIPQLHEFYLIGYEYQYDEVKLIISDIFEKTPNLLGFSTMQYIWENRKNLDRVANKLGWQNKDNQEKEIEKAKYLINYLEDKYNYTNTIYDTYAFQTWRFMSKMINEAGYMLRDGLHAKAIFYEFSRYNCEDMDVIPFYEACGTKYDFTLSAKNAIIWINAALSNKDSYSFKQIQKDLNANEEILSDYLYLGKSKFSQKLNQFKQIIANFYHCSYSFCQAEEMWYKQWGNSSVTQNYPKELNFLEQDKVKTIAHWDIYEDKVFVHYEFFSFCETQLSIQIQQKLFQFDMGGIFGYYSLRNLFENYFDPNIKLHPNFPVRDEELTLVVQYIMHCLTNYWYGGHLIKTKQSKYLFDYDNTYTDNLQTFEPVYEGSSFRDNGAYLIQPNNKEFYKFATMYDYYRMDTGIKNITNVGTVVMTLDESIIRQKQIIYYNESSEYLIAEYRYPYDTKSKVTGSYGYVFKPNLKEDFQSTLQLFDYEINNNQTLYYTRSSKYEDYDVLVYNVQNQLTSLEPSTKLPIYITIGKYFIENCAPIDGKTCNQFMSEQNDSEYQIEEVTGTVVSIKKTYIYWLKIDQFSPLRQYPLNYDLYIPLVKREMTYQYSSEQMDQYFQDVKDLENKNKTIFLVTLLFGLMFSLGFIGVIVYFRKNEQNIKARAPSIYSVVSEE